jgi:acetyl esterase/lipase
LVYRQVNGRSLRLDLYLPEKEEGALPLVVWVHGGAWMAGSKENPRSALVLLSHGFAVASVSYRLSQVATFPAQIEDCKAAIRWLRAHAPEYKINRDRIGVWGPSAGGHLAALLGTSGHQKEWDVGELLEFSSAVQAVCDWFGPTDFLRMDDQPGAMVHLSANSPESRLIGGDVREQPGRVAAANPITFITESCPPFLILHGREDRTVIPSQSALLHEALQKAGVSSRLILLDDAGHGGRAFDEQVPAVMEFFTNTLLRR